MKQEVVKGLAEVWLVGLVNSTFGLQSENPSVRRLSVQFIVKVRLMHCAQPESMIKQASDLAKFHVEASGALNILSASRLYAMLSALKLTYVSL